MRPRTTWAIVSSLALAATVGVWLGPGAGRKSGDQNTAPAGATHAGAESAETSEKDNELACNDIAHALELFLSARNLPRPNSCSTGDALQAPPAQPVAKRQTEHAPEGDLRFVVATLPDPIHTHLALLFDRLTEVVQDAAQDEEYSYEASWMPWQDQEKDYGSLTDDDSADNRKHLRESQPGIILFRRASDAKQTGRTQAQSQSVLGPYVDGLIVFVVGEDPTRGIHVEQFTNALAWVSTLKLWEGTPFGRLAILGPSFSGSFPSLAKLITVGTSGDYLRDIGRNPASELAIYTGTANSGAAIAAFGPTAYSENLNFHGFLERDEVELERYCKYVKAQSVDPARIAVLSEDETAYGGNGSKDETAGGNGAGPCLRTAHWFYYPRDISALRAAYQNNSTFDLPGQASSASAPGRLPTDLADPEGIGHDTIQSYAGNQTPDAEEAYLLGIVNAMRVYHSEYVILRSTNPLDQLFLARYLRRAYPDARVVVDGADRLFERDRGASGVGGTMGLSTYPLIATERKWIAGSDSTPGQRSFNSDTSEGTYIAFRLLLHTVALSRDPSDSCALRADEAQFRLSAVTTNGSLPSLPPACNASLSKSLLPPIPDYGMPSGTASKDCDGQRCAAFQRPATWLSVLARDGYWAIAAINEQTIYKGDLSPPRDAPPSETPLSLNIALIMIGGFVCFHLWCCSKASFTAKPAFLTHFASGGDWRHMALVALGSLLVGLLPLLVGWGSGLFDPSPTTSLHRPWMLAIVLAECFTALAAGILNIWRVQSLANANGGRTRALVKLGVLILLAGIVGFYLGFAWPLERSLTPANRFFTYYRGMHLLSGVSPILPVFLLAVGMYAWFWNSLHGLALFGPDRPTLPEEKDLLIENRGGNSKWLRVLPMFSQEKAGDPTERGAKPLSKGIAGCWILLFVCFVAIVWTVSRETPVRSLGARYFAVFFLLLLIACFSLMLAEAWQLLRTWTKLRELLVFLDRTPLRRTLAGLRGFSWGSVWGMSGNVLDVRYKLLSRQIESLRHTRAALDAASAEGLLNDNHFRVYTRECIAALAKLNPEGHDGRQSGQTQDNLEILNQLWQSPKETTQAKFETASNQILAQALGTGTTGVGTPDEVEKDLCALERSTVTARQNESEAERRCLDAVAAAQQAGTSFAVWYADNYCDPNAGNFELLERFQESLAETAGTLLVNVLVPEWQQESDSLILEQEAGGADNDEDERNVPPLSAKKHIRDAEEFVSLPYLGFVQNILGRMRTSVMGILWLFVAATVAISSYPFDPRQGLSGVMLALFIVLGVVILYVYVQMHRDATLSHVTNTTPGELGADFWLKALSFGVAPLMGLLVTIFPSITDFVFSWLQPGLQAMK